MQTPCGVPRPSVNDLARTGGRGYPGNVEPEPASYSLDDQIGYVLRRVTQRHLAIFSDAIPEVTTMQFAVLARLGELGPLSQNLLGRATAMDGATVKGVVDRLVRQGHVTAGADPADRRRLIVALTESGGRLLEERRAAALAVSDRTLGPLNEAERACLIELLNRLT